MTGPIVSVALTGPRCGYMIAVQPPQGQEHAAPSLQTRSGTVLAVGSVYRRSGDGEPEAWKAWLWPQAGGDLAVTQHCDAVDATSREKLRERLQERADKNSGWWKGAR